MMKSYCSLFLPLLAAACCVFSDTAVAEDDAAELEVVFIAMLKNASLEGTWVPIQGGQSSGQKADRYSVVRAEKVEGDQWHIVSKMKHQGQEIEFPIPVTVKWAGDTAVMILDEVATGGGKSYSARVLFHNDRYAGSWWASDQAGGLLSGTISRK
jgi:hypothetical protein